MVLEKTLESPLDCKIHPVHPKGSQSWIFTERTDVEAETPVLWPPHTKSWLIWKDPDAGRDWGQEEKGMTGWDGWMASPTQWTWVWVDSGSWCWTGRLGMLRFTGSQRVGHDWATELNWCPFLFLFHQWVPATTLFWYYINLILKTSNYKYPLLPKSVFVSKFGTWEHGHRGHLCLSYPLFGCQSRRIKELCTRKLTLPYGQTWTHEEWCVAVSIDLPELSFHPRRKHLSCCFLPTVLFLSP